MNFKNDGLGIIRERVGKPADKVTIYRFCIIYFDMTVSMLVQHHTKTGTNGSAGLVPGNNRLVSEQLIAVVIAN